MKTALGVTRRRTSRTAGWGVEQSRRRYSDGSWDCFGELIELPRYSQLIGYLRELHTSPDVLDIGCGRGLLRARLPADSFASYLGVDALPEVIGVAQRYADERTRFRVGELASIAGQTFDVVVANEVLYMFDDLAVALAKIDDALRDDGLLLTSNYVHGRSGELRRALGRSFDLVDAVHIVNPANPAASRGWDIASHRKRQ